MFPFPVRTAKATMAALTPRPRHRHLNGRNIKLASENATKKFNIPAGASPAGAYMQAARLATVVFGIYELCELIILALRLEDFQAITLVNTSRHYIALRSTRVNQYLLFSEFFQTKIHSSMPTSNERFLFRFSDWGRLVVRRLPHQELVMVGRKVYTCYYDPKPTKCHYCNTHGIARLSYEAHFITADEILPALRPDDRKRLRRGWMTSLKHRDSKLKEEFLRRFSIALRKHADAR